MDPEPGTYTLIPDRGDRRPITLTVRDGDVARFDAPKGPITGGLTQLIVEPDALPAGQRRCRRPGSTSRPMDRPRPGSSSGPRSWPRFPTAYVRLAAESRATSRVFEEFGRVVGLGLIGTLVLAGCSLAVAVSTSVLERRRQFALLRSAGMPVSRLRALVLLQAGAPLFAVAVLSAVLGIVVAQVILRLATVDAVPWPDPSLGVTLGGQPARRPAGRGPDAAAARTHDPARDRPRGVARLEHRAGPVTWSESLPPTRAPERHACQDAA